MRNFKKTRAFNYVYERTITDGFPYDEIIKVPSVPSKHSVCDIAWAMDGNIQLYATIEEDPDDMSLWEEVKPGAEINKAVTAFRITCEDVSRIVIRVIMH